VVKELHICLNMVSDPNWSGGVLYIQNLVKAIASLPLAERENIKLTLAVRKSNIDLAEPIKAQINQIYARSFLNRGYFALLKLLAGKVEFIPSEFLNPRTYDFVYPDFAGKGLPYKWAGWIPDFQHHYLPDLFSQQEIDKRNHLFQKLADFAPIIILSSQMAQADFCRLYPHACDRSKVMQFASYTDPNWFALDPQLIQAKYQLSDRFFLVSNQFWKHKDHAVVVEALGLLKQRQIYPVVVCTGSLTDYRHPKYFHELLSRVDELGLSQNFIVLGMIPRIDQIQLMRTCLAVIQPSLFEGWSSVIEDARSLGKPAIASDFPVHLEQKLPSCQFFERGNVEALADQIAKAVLNFKHGVNHEAERLARQDNHKRVTAYGRRFLEIVRNVV
jgi:glycosyltransferase involved in cell wall biosynthesis